jgi:hypothetical protein
LGGGEPEPYRVRAPPDLIGERAGRDPLTLTHHGQQEMLGTDVIMVEALGLCLSQRQHPMGLVREWCGSRADPLQRLAHPCLELPVGAFCSSGGCPAFSSVWLCLLIAHLMV